MIIACPECSGKLSSAAPSCPHCGYIQTPAAVTAPPAAPAPAPSSAPLGRGTSEGKLEAPPELVLPSEESVKKAARIVWSEWVHASVWRMFIGAAILLAALGLMFLVFMLALRMNDGPTREIRVEKASTP